MTMAVKAADVAKLRSMPDTHDVGDLAALQSIPEVIAYLATCARHEGADEADWAELLVRITDMATDDVRRVQAVLRPLGYSAVADRLRQIAGRRKHCRAPLE
jgi:hypothetical protein